MKIAINKTVINKPNDEQKKKKMTFTYENVDITANRLAEYVNQGFAFCAQHKNSKRKAANFIASDFLAVDIDEGMTVSEALSDSFVQSCSSFLYTTPSHTEDFPRFRIVFALPCTITDKNEMTLAYSGLIKRFGGDPSCTDACRQFFGSKGGLIKLFDKILPSQQLDKLLLIGGESQQVSDTASLNANRSSIRSRTTLDPDSVVVDSSNEEQRLGDLPAGVPVHCPMHADKKASAFTVMSKQGVIGVYCSKCCTTYFTSHDMPLYDFNYGLRNLKNIKPITYQEGLFTYEKPGTLWLSEPYLPNLNLQSEYIFVKSPKGTGKTQWLEHVVHQCKKHRRSVLLIGHRQSLISSIAKRLGLMPYINFSNGDTTHNNNPSKYYAICADSLPKLLNPKHDHYDVVLIDEVEQVLSHLTDSTVKDKRNTVFLYFKHFVKKANQVYAMDADLNKLTVDAITNFDSIKQSDFTFIINEHKTNNRAIDIYQSESHLYSHLLKSISSGERCFVCSNSKTKVLQFETAIRKQFSGSRKIIAITSKNSDREHIQDFIRNIQTLILEYDVILVSPSVGTGVDITFENNESKIDCVYGFFESRINTHFDIDQQLCRVRHPKATSIWISPETFRFEHDSDMIKHEVQQSSMASRRLVAIESDGTLKYDDDWTTEYLDLYANVVSMRRGSKNNLVHHFKKMKSYYGWVINDIDMDKDAAKTGAQRMRQGKDAHRDTTITQITTAKLITHDEYQILRKASKQISLVDEQINAMRRYEIESFYYQPVTEELIKQDNNGRLRNEIREYENYIGNEFHLKQLDIMDENTNMHFTDRKARLLRRQLLHRLFVSSGLANDENHLLIDTHIQADQLIEFVKLFRECKMEIARIFNMDIRKDIDIKPAQQLGTLLKLIGISWTRTSTKFDGKRIYRYKITQKNIDAINAIVSTRNDADVTADWHEQRELITNNRLFTSDDTQSTYSQIKDQAQASPKTLGN